MTDEIPAAILAALSPEDKACLEGLSRQGINAWAMSKRSQVEEYLSCLSALHYFTVPVSRLPNELLVEIMRHVRDIHRTRPAEWIKIAQVCRHWRTIALTAPQLWNTIDLDTSEKDRLQLLQMCLHRSGHSLLDISMMPTNLSFPSMLEQVTLHAHRLFNLRLVRLLRDREQSGTGPLTRLLASPMPELKTLTLSGLTVDSNLPIFVLSAESMPHLQSLSLSCVGTSWDPLTSMSLVRLELDYQSPAPSIDLFLDVLSANHRLEQLKMRNAGPRPINTEYISPKRRVSLPNLRTLTMENYPETVSYQLSHIVLPSIIDVNMISWYDESNARQEYLAAITPGGVPLPHLSTVRSLSLNVTDQHYSLRASSADFNDSFTSESPASFSLDIAHQRNRRARLATLDQALEELTRVLSTPQVASMHITYISGMGLRSERLWRHVLVHFHLLQRLKIEYHSDDDAIRPFLLALGGPRSQFNQSICPGLKTLHIYGPLFEQSHVDILISGLEARASLGMRLDTLRLEIRTQKLLFSDAVSERLRSSVSNTFECHECDSAGDPH